MESGFLKSDPLSVSTSQNTETYPSFSNFWSGGYWVGPVVLAVILLICFTVAADTVSAEKNSQKNDSVRWIDSNFVYRTLEKNQTSAVYYNDSGGILENNKLRAHFSTRGGRLARIDWKPTHPNSAPRKALYQCPEAHYRAVNEGNMFLLEGITVLGGNFLTFPGPEHGAYFNSVMNMAVDATEEEGTVTFSQVDRSTATRSPRFSEYLATGGTFTTAYSLRRGQDVIRAHVKAEYPSANAMTAVWYATSPTVGNLLSQDTQATSNCRWVTKTSVTNIYAHDDWSWLKDKPQNEAFSTVQYPYQWPNLGIAYIRSNWLATVDNGQAFVTYTVQDMFLKLWSWGSKANDHNAYSSHYQPYPEFWISPVNRTFDGKDGIAVTAGQKIEFDVFQFIVDAVSFHDPSTVRTKVEAKIAEINLMYGVSGSAT